MAAGGYDDDVMASDWLPTDCDGDDDVMMSDGLA